MGMTPSGRATTGAAGYARFLVGMLRVVVSLNYMDRQAVFSVFPPLRCQLATSEVAVDSMASVFLWVLWRDFT